MAQGMIQLLYSSQMPFSLWHSLSFATTLRQTQALRLGSLSFWLCSVSRLKWNARCTFDKKAFFHWTLRMNCVSWGGKSREVLGLLIQIMTIRTIRNLYITTLWLLALSLRINTLKHTVKVIISLERFYRPVGWCIRLSSNTDVVLWRGISSCSQAHPRTGDHDGGSPRRAQVQPQPAPFHWHRCQIFLKNRLFHLLSDECKLFVSFYQAIRITTGTVHPLEMCSLPSLCCKFANSLFAKVTLAQSEQ